MIAYLHSCKGLAMKTLKAKDLQTKGGYSLKPGEKRFDASGREISTGGPEPFKDEYSRAAGRQLSLDELIGAKTKVAEAGRQTINLPKITLERESGLVEQGIKDIKESKKDVLMSRAAIDRIDQALAIVEKQGDKVAGVQGQIRRALAPFERPPSACNQADNCWKNACHSACREAVLSGVRVCSLSVINCCKVANRVCGVGSAGVAVTAPPDAGKTPEGV